MSGTGITKLSFFFSKRVFHVNVIIVAFLTFAGPFFLLFVGGVLIGNNTTSEILRGAVRNESMMLCWVIYIVSVTLLPFTYVLPKLKKNKIK